LILLAVAACGQSASHKDAGTGDDDDGGSNVGDDADTTCTAPNMLILLDRTGTMHRNLAGNTPTDDPAGHASAKLTIAINALDALMGTAGIDQSLRLGLAMFPRDPGGGKCDTLTERLQGKAFTNTNCEMGEVIIEPALGTAASIAAAIDPETTTICNSTPIGAGLQTAQTDLLTHVMPGVDQYIMLVTDGADFADSCPTPDPLEVLRQLDAMGTKTFIVGFGAQDTTTGGVNPPVLNQLACAGHTAKDFATNCKQVTGGGYDAVDPTNGPRLYYDAADAAALSTSLKAVAGSVCCGCIL
jgi:hypothetical protein